MAVTRVGRVKWSGHRNEEGHRSYEVTFLVETNTPADGPGSVTSSLLLPQIGAPWTYGNDNDSWAFCTPFIKAVPIIDKEPGKQWHVTYRFSTIPITRCQDQEVAIPFAEPPKISGGTSSGSREATEDKDANPIVNAAHEPVGVDFDYGLPTVRVSQNINPLNLTALSDAVNKVNSTSMWGLGTRRVLLASYSFERRYWGSCTLYYNRTLEFKIDFDTFDRSDIPNLCTKMIQGEWDGDTYNIDAGRDVANPTHFHAAKDKEGNLTEMYISKTTGAPVTTPNYLDLVAFHQEYNFFTLGIPASI